MVGPVAALDLDWAGHRPLAGLTVVVTRSAPQAGTLSAALARAGARVLEVPIIEITAPADGGAALAAAAAAAATYDWVVFTSANTASPVRRPCSATAGHSAGPGWRPSGRPPWPPWPRPGWWPTWSPRRPAPWAWPRPCAGRHAGPAGPAGRGGHRRVLYPRAEEARPTLPEALRAEGWEVDEVVAYRTVPAAGPPAAVEPSLAGADVVTFTSPSTVAAYLAMRTSGGEPLAVPAVVACIGPVTAEAARAAGLAVAVEAAEPSPGALVAAIAAARGAAGA